MSKFDDILDIEIKKYQKNKTKQNKTNTDTNDQQLKPGPLNAKHLLFKSSVEKTLKTKK